MAKKYLVSVPQRDIESLPVKFREIGLTPAQTKQTGLGRTTILGGTAEMFHELIRQCREVADKKNGRTGPTASRDRTQARQIIVRAERALRTGPTEDLEPVAGVCGWCGQPTEWCTCPEGEERFRVAIPMLLYVTVDGAASLREAIVRAEALQHEIMLDLEPTAELEYDGFSDCWIWGAAGAVTEAP